MGKQKKKRPVKSSRLELGEGFGGYLMVLKRRPEFQDLSGITGENKQKKGNRDDTHRK